MTSFPAFTLLFVQKYNKRKLHSSLKVGILFSRRKKQYFTHSLRSFIKYCFLSLENKVHIFAPPCNILYLLLYFILSVSQGTDIRHVAGTHEQTDHTLSSSSYPVTQASQSPPYTTPLSTKTELRSTRDHHVVDVRQQNTVVPPPQQAHARSDKPSKLHILKTFYFSR